MISGGEDNHVQWNSSNHFSEVSLFQQFWGKIAREKLALLVEKRPY